MTIKRVWNRYGEQRYICLECGFGMHEDAGKLKHPETDGNRRPIPCKFAGERVKHPDVMTLEVEGER